MNYPSEDSKSAAGMVETYSEPTKEGTVSMLSGQFTDVILNLHETVSDLNQKLSDFLVPLATESKDDIATSPRETRFEGLFKDHLTELNNVCDRLQHLYERLRV